MSSSRAGPAATCAASRGARIASPSSMRSPSLVAVPPPDNLDVKALEGHGSWLRLRVGAYRILYRPLSVEELATVGRRRGGQAEAGYLVARIVHRRDLERAVDTLP